MKDKLIDLYRVSVNGRKFGDVFKNSDDAREFAVKTKRDADANTDKPVKVTVSRWAENSAGDVIGKREVICSAADIVEAVKWAVADEKPCANCGSEDTVVTVRCLIMGTFSRFCAKCR